MWDDLRLAGRRLRNSPGFVITAVSTLALAVGANTAIFTVADAVLFRPLPYHDPDRLFVIRSVDHKTGFRSSAVPFAYVDAVRQRHSGVASVALRSTTIFISHVGSEGGEVRRGNAVFGVMRQSSEKRSGSVRWIASSWASCRRDSFFQPLRCSAAMS